MYKNPFLQKYPDFWNFYNCMFQKGNKDVLITNSFQM